MVVAPVMDDTTHTTHKHPAHNLVFTNKYRKYFRATKIRVTIHVKSSKRIPPNIDTYLRMDEKT